MLNIFVLLLLKVYNLVSIDDFNLNLVKSLDQSVKIHNTQSTFIFLFHDLSKAFLKQNLKFKKWVLSYQIFIQVDRGVKLNFSGL